MKPSVKTRLQRPRSQRTATDKLPVASEFAPKVNLKPEQEDVRGLGLNEPETKPRSRPNLVKKVAPFRTPTY